MARFYKYLLVLGFISFIHSPGFSQNLLDGLRLTQNPISTGVRSFAMGGAMIAAANDYSALDFNPAALTILEHGEISLSLFNKSSHSDAQFLGTTTGNDINNTIPYSFAYAAPIETVRGHLAFGISYDRVNDFTSSYKFSAVNNSSSFLNSKNFVQDPGWHSGNFKDYLQSLDFSNLAWALFLTNTPDSLNPTLKSNYTSGLLQSGTVTQEGGTNALRIGAGIDVAENIAVGATVNIIFGTYDYRKVYNETNLNTSDTSTSPPAGFRSAQIVDTRSQSMNGVNVKFGLYSEPNEYIRVGLTFETPTFFSIDDRYSRYGISNFNNGKTFDSREIASSLNPTIVNSYSVTTPLKLGAGVSFNHWDVTFAASAEYADYSQLHFTDDNVDLNDLNDAARDQLRGVLSWHIGAEYFIKPIGVLVRGGYQMQPSSFKNDPSEYNTKSISGGLGILLSKAAMLELSYKNTTYRTDHSIYNSLSLQGAPISASINQNDIRNSEFTVAFSFRF